MSPAQTVAGKNKASVIVAFTPGKSPGRLAGGRTYVLRYPAWRLAPAEGTAAASPSRRLLPLEGRWRCCLRRRLRSIVGDSGLSLSVGVGGGGGSLFGASGGSDNPRRPTATATISRREQASVPAPGSHGSCCSRRRLRRGALQRCTAAALPEGGGSGGQQLGRADLAVRAYFCPRRNSLTPLAGGPSRCRRQRRRPGTLQAPLPHTGHRCGAS